MCLAQGPQRGESGEARTRGLESGTLPLSHCAPLFSMDVKQEINLKPFIFTQPHSFFIAALSDALV